METLHRKIDYLSVSKHVRMDIEIRQTCRLSVTLDEPVYHASRQRSTLLGNEQWTTTVGRHLLAFSQPVLDWLDLSSVKRVRRRYATFETVDKHVFLGEVNVRDFQSTGFRGSKAMVNHNKEKAILPLGMTRQALVLRSLELVVEGRRIVPSILHCLLSRQILSREQRTPA